MCLVPTGHPTLSLPTTELQGVCVLVVGGGLLAGLSYTNLCPRSTACDHCLIASKMSTLLPEANLEKYKCPLFLQMTSELYISNFPFHL